MFAILLFIAISDAISTNREKRYAGKKCRSGKDCDDQCAAGHGGCDSYKKTCTDCFGNTIIIDKDQLSDMI